MATALARFNGCTMVYATPPPHEKGASFLLPKSASFYTRRFSAFSLPAMASSPPSSSQTMAPENDNSSPDVYQQIQSHQAAAIRLTPVEEVRTVLDRSVLSMLSTFSAKYDGHPSESMIDFACDLDGSPVLAVSLAVHTKDLLANPRCSLLVARDPEHRTDLVINFHGDAISVSGKDNEAARNAYLKRHPHSFWVDFGDFQFIRIVPKVVRYVSWVATICDEFDPETYKAAKVDPIAQFSNRVASHMNKDQADETRAIVQHSTSVPVDFASILDLDSLGFYVEAVIKARLSNLEFFFQGVRKIERTYKHS